ncbi:FAM50-like protein [Mya arenaria]|uniref:FAM50-like protein n=1 Tax=Mya arenaria TaxID=6604 RepID=A0ABY7FAQ7_MYAAR|nr:FAM50-like protein [Mya arenaria]
MIYCRKINHIMAHYKGAASEGGRAQILIKKRQKEQEELEQRKKKIEEDLNVGSIQNKFASHYDAIEQQLKSNTVAREKQLAKKDAEARLIEKQRKDRKQNEKKQEEEEEVPVPAKKKRLGMNPDVDTSFLPDKDREEEENRLREQIAQEWRKKQETIKNEEIEITYSYWDGSGHRRQVRMKKGNTMQQFLHKSLETLRKEFNDLKAVTVDQLMYVKEDLIIPHHYSFYDFIVTKARGKSGPLFNFNVKDDIRITNDASVEKEESHAGKVCVRSWYERNKHIFPASRWEPYDPEKKWDSYSVSDKNAAKITVK